MSLSFSYPCPGPQSPEWISIPLVAWEIMLNSEAWIRKWCKKWENIWGMKSLKMDSTWANMEPDCWCLTSKRSQLNFRTSFWGKSNRKCRRSRMIHGSGMTAEMFWVIKVRLKYTPCWIGQLVPVAQNCLLSLAVSFWGSDKEKCFLMPAAWDSLTGNPGIDLPQEKHVLCHWATQRLGNKLQERKLNCSRRAKCCSRKCTGEAHWHHIDIYIKM